MELIIITGKVNQLEECCFVPITDGYPSVCRCNSDCRKKQYFKRNPHYVNPGYSMTNSHDRIEHIPGHPPTIVYQTKYLEKMPYEYDIVIPEKPLEALLGDYSLCIIKDEDYKGIYNIKLFDTPNNSNPYSLTIIPEDNPIKQIRNILSETINGETRANLMIKYTLLSKYSIIDHNNEILQDLLGIECKTLCHTITELAETFSIKGTRYNKSSHKIINFTHRLLVRPYIQAPKIYSMLNENILSVSRILNEIKTISNEETKLDTRILSKIDNDIIIVQLNSELSSTRDKIIELDDENTKLKIKVEKLDKKVERLIKQKSKLMNTIYQYDNFDTNLEILRLKKELGQKRIYPNNDDASNILNEL
jgi:hypothetical protein